MNCPVHSDVECRDEHHADGHTSFCPVCLKHYPMCKSTIYMDACRLQLGHVGPHLDRHGQYWEQVEGGHWVRVKGNTT